jgi:hypothetical protein
MHVTRRQRCRRADEQKRGITALNLTMTRGPYDRASAVIDGTVKAEGIELAITVNDDNVERQRQAARGDSEVCEFFTGTYSEDLPFKKLDFTAIPIFAKAHVSAFLHLHQQEKRHSRSPRPQRQARGPSMLQT